MWCNNPEDPVFTIATHIAMQTSCPA